MNTYCLSCKKDTRNINPNIIKTKSNRKFVSRGSGIFDSLVYNTNRDRIKDALLRAFK